MPEHYRETERCPDCGDMIPVGIPHTMRECAIARERAVRKAQAEGDALELERRLAAQEIGRAHV